MRFERSGCAAYNLAQIEGSLEGFSSKHTVLGSNSPQVKRLKQIGTDMTIDEEGRESVRPG